MQLFQHSVYGQCYAQERSSQALTEGLRVLPKEENHKNMNKWYESEIFFEYIFILWVLGSVLIKCPLILVINYDTLFYCS